MLAGHLLASHELASHAEIPRIAPAGDTALTVDFGDRVDIQVSGRVLSLARRLEALQLAGVVEIVPTIRSLIIYYEPLDIDTATLTQRVHDLLQHVDDAVTAFRTWRLPVCYDPALAPDVDRVADRCGLSHSQLVALHSSAVYHVYMLGFLPGLAYLGDVPDVLDLPRRKTPRRSIPAGSVGIANGMTAIYPRETPCGWHLVGRSPARLWDLERPGGALLTAGDKVTFEPISLREYERESHRSGAGIGRTNNIETVA
jgi:KipI family sensor histidine kinase inhibitor